MAQIAGKWISDGAITASKIDTSSTFTFQGLRVTQDASVIGDLTVNGTIALPNATINKYLYVNAGHVVEYVDATGGGASAHGVTLNTAPVAEDTTGWRNSAFSMSADDSTAYITQDASVIGNFTVDGTIALPNATINKFLYVNASNAVVYADATSVPAHGIALNTAPVAEDTTGWRSSAFSMSADDSTAYITQDASVTGNFTVDGTITLPSATINKYLHVNASYEIEYTDATGSAPAHGVQINTLPVAADTTGWRDSGYSMSADDATAYATASTSVYLTTNTRNVVSLVGDPAGYSSAIELSTKSGNGMDRTSSIIIEGSPYTTSTITIKTGHVNLSSPDSSQNLASIYLDSRFPGSEGAIIQLDTGNAQIKQRASMIPFDNEYISLTVPRSFVYIDSGSGGLAQICTGDTTYQGLGTKASITAISILLTGDTTCTGKWACNGSSPQPKYAVGTDATDLTSALLLVNSIKTALINDGIAKTA